MKIKVLILLLIVISCQSQIKRYKWSGVLDSGNIIRNVVQYIPEDTCIVTDYDGNCYDTVHIGTQIWLKQNLKVMHYNNGDVIHYEEDFNIWRSLTIGGFCHYGNNYANVSIYGEIYNWNAINDPRGIAPTGWHVATVSDWAVLSNYLGGDSIAGGKLKEVGTEHWDSPNTGATDEYGFKALPGGYRDENGTFGGRFLLGIWWAYGGGLLNESIREIYWVYAELRLESVLKRYGLSVRCIKD
jgi:uncharacterized protein (TIGR02145 family)